MKILRSITMPPSRFDLLALVVFALHENRNESKLGRQQPRKLLFRNVTNTAPGKKRA
jgi:hypothetical protein